MSVRYENEGSTDFVNIHKKSGEKLFFFSNPPQFPKTELEGVIAEFWQKPDEIIRHLATREEYFGLFFTTGIVGNFYPYPPVAIRTRMYQDEYGRWCQAPKFGSIEEALEEIKKWVFNGASVSVMNGQIALNESDLRPKYRAMFLSSAVDIPS